MKKAAAKGRKGKTGSKAAQERGNAEDVDVSRTVRRESGNANDSGKAITTGKGKGKGRK